MNNQHGQQHRNHWSSRVSEQQGGAALSASSDSPPSSSSSDSDSVRLRDQRRRLRRSNRSNEPASADQGTHADDDDASLTRSVDIDSMDNPGVDAATQEYNASANAAGPHSGRASADQNLDLDDARTGGQDPPELTGTASPSARSEPGSANRAGRVLLASGSGHIGHRHRGSGGMPSASS